MLTQTVNIQICLLTSNPDTAALDKNNVVIPSRHVGIFAFQTTCGFKCKILVCILHKCH